MKENKLYKIIYNDLIDKIKDGKLKAGDKLPTEMELGKIYNVSRITISHSLKILAEMNIIYRVKKSGTFINGKINRDNKQLIIPFILHNETNYSIYEYASRIAVLNNIYLKLYFTYNNEEKERKILGEISELNISGIIIYPVQSHKNIDLYSLFKIKKIPFVFIDRRIEGINTSIVTSNNKQGLYYLVNNLISSGHKKIAYFAIHENMASTEKDRFSGYCDALINNGIALNLNYIYNSSKYFTMTSLKNSSYNNEYIDKNCKKFVKNYIMMQNKPTAIVCCNDISAINIMLILQKNNIRIPDDVSITGFDSIKELADYTPVISTIEQDYKKIGENTITALINLISNINDIQTYNINVNIKKNQSVKNLNE